MPQRLKFFLHNRKKIWQSRRSLRSRFVYYLASLFLVGVTSLLLLLNAIGVLQPLNYDLERFMNYELDALILTTSSVSWTASQRITRTCRSSWQMKLSRRCTCSA